MADERLTALTALLPLLQQWMDDAPVDRKAALVAQYRATLQEIAELAPPEQKGDAVDEIARRRAARRSSPAPGAGRTKRPS